RDIGQGAGGSPNFRRQIGKRTDGVTKDRGSAVKLGPGEQHAVTGIPAETKGDLIPFRDGQAPRGGCTFLGGRHAILFDNSMGEAGAGTTRDSFTPPRAGAEK